MFGASRRSRPRAGRYAAVITLALGAVVVGPAAMPAAATSCSHGHSAISTNGPLLVTGSDVAMREGPHVDCGLVERFTAVYMTPWCWVPGDHVTRNGITYTTWSFVSVAGWGEPVGWISDAYLSDNGANQRC